MSAAVRWPVALLVVSLVAVVLGAVPVAAQSRLATPIVSSGVVSGDSVTFSWDEVDRHSGYHLQYWLPSGHNVYSSTSSDSFDVPMSEGPGVYCIQVIAVGPPGDSERSERLCTDAQPAATCLGRQITVDLNRGQTPTSGDDVIIGTPARDVINGLAGNDWICGEGGNDVLLGGDGDDSIDGGDGDDQIDGHAGHDLINGGNGNDELLGSTGNDTINGGPGNDQLAGYLGDDTLNGDDGDDIIFAWTGFDTLNGGAGDDKLAADEARDVTVGGPGVDVCYNGTYSQCESTGIPSTPTGRTAEFDGDKFTFTWTPSAEADEYDWELTRPNGTVADDETSSASLTEPVRVGDSGEHCLRVRARGFARSRSAWSAPWCTDGSWRLATPVIAPVTVTGENVVFDWADVPGRVAYHWAVFSPANGVVRGESLASMHTARHNDVPGNWCVEVVAVKGGRDSARSQRTCGYVAPPPPARLATPVISSATSDQSNVTFDWQDVPERGDYHWALFRPDGHVIRGADPASRYTTAHNALAGDWCFEVIAVFPGRDSAVSDRACATVDGVTSLSRPVMSSVTQSGDEVKFGWAKVDHATAYRFTVRSGNQMPRVAETNALSITATRQLPSDGVCVDVVAIGHGLESATSTKCQQGEVVGSITGGIANFSGTVRQPIDGIEVCATPTSGDPICTVSTADGSFSLDDLRIGNYRIELTDPLGRYLSKCVGAGGYDCSVAASPINGVSSANPVELSDNIHMEPRVVINPSPPVVVPEPIDDLAPYWKNGARLRVADHTVKNPNDWGMDLAWYRFRDDTASQHYFEPHPTNGIGVVKEFEIFLNDMNTPWRVVPNESGNEIVEIRGLSYGVPYSAGVRIVDSAGNKSTILTADLIEPVRDLDPTLEPTGTTGQTVVVPASTPETQPEDPVFTYPIPPAPQGQVVDCNQQTDISANSVEVEWGGALTGSSSYYVQARRSSNNQLAGQTSYGQGRSATITGLSSNTQYLIAIAGLNSQGVESKRCTFGVTTSLPEAPAISFPNEAPGLPDPIIPRQCLWAAPATVEVDGNADVTWSTPTNSMGQTPTSWRVTVSTHPDPARTSAIIESVVVSGEPKFTLTDAEWQTTYFVRIVPLFGGVPAENQFCQAMIQTVTQVDTYSPRTDYRSIAYCDHDGGGIGLGIWDIHCVATNGTDLALVTTRNAGLTLGFNFTSMTTYTTSNVSNLRDWGGRRDGCLSASFLEVSKNFFCEGGGSDYFETRIVVNDTVSPSFDVVDFTYQVQFLNPGTSAYNDAFADMCDHFGRAGQRWIEGSSFAGCP